MAVKERPPKRMKRRVSADLYDFLTFPNSASFTWDAFPQPFRTSVMTFLSNHARLLNFPSSFFPSLITWQILFRVGDLVLDGSGSCPVMVSLYIVEEDVARSRSVYCNQCRVVGWSGHPVCRKRYHFIIRAESNVTDGFQKPCSRCGNLLNLSETRCKWCNMEITTEDGEDWVYSQFEDNSHLLHGVVHSNGYGHLLTVNGREGGSKLLSGFDIMNFWDRLCTTLSVRKVTVMDVSKKYGIEYRLLHAIIKGHSWYGNWGYEFGAASYALTQDSYKRAVGTLSTIPLTSFYRGRKPRTRLQDVIAFYKSLSDTELLTIRDLFSFLLTLIHRNHKPLKATTSSVKPQPGTNVLCTWTRNDVERVQKAMIKVLLASNSSDPWVTRRALKGTMCKTASPELVDYCLKHLGGSLTSNGMVVQARCNPSSTDVEFRLQPSSVVYNVFGSDDSYRPSEEQVIRDLRFLYDSIFHDTLVTCGHQVLREKITDSAAKIIDCKQFMKDYKLDKMATQNSHSAVNIWCHVELLDQPKDDLPLPPPELIVLTLSATVADLKAEASKAFQEVYIMFKRFEIDELAEYGCIEDSITLKFLVGLSGSIQIRGRCPVKHGLNRYRMERGIESWTVKCVCGAKDDDGEKMLACDTCGIWQHTRCSGIDSSDSIPPKFICKTCVDLYLNESKRTSKSDDVSLSSTCRGDIAATHSQNVESNLAFDVR